MMAYKNLAITINKIFVVYMEVQRWKNDYWLREKSNEYGVVTLPSGLMYKELNSLYFGRNPTLTSNCVCHYTGSFIDGKVFDSTYQRNMPCTFAPNQVIAGWTEALLLMKEGEKWELYIPSNLAYGEDGQENIIPGDTPLQFIIELLKIQD